MSIKWKIGIVTATIALIMLTGVIVAAVSLTTCGTAPPPFAGVKKLYSKSDAILRDRHGVVIQEMRIDFDARKLDWTAIGDVSPAVMNAVILSEDKRFRSHKGVDWTALTYAAARTAFSRDKRGASTITMQLASFLNKGLKPDRTKRTIGQKWDQIKAALAIERSWTKDQILEAYLNMVTFRGELQGISAASRGLFGKEPSGLNMAEALVLASLIRAPNASAADVAKRAAAIGATSGLRPEPAELKVLSAEALSKGYNVKPKVELAPQVAAKLLTKDKMEAVTTLDGVLQKEVSEILEHAVKDLSDRNVQDGAALVVDNRTGEVLAYVANTGIGSSARFVDGVIAKRQAGSTLKPLLYGLAFERKLLTPASLVDDSPLDIPTLRGTYSPEDYDKEYRGMVSARVALASSLNVPAVRTLSVTGVDAFARRLTEVGFTDLQDADYYGLSLALGTAEVNLWELVNAYRTIANGGEWSGLKLSFDERTGRRRVYSPESAFLVSDILSDREARSTTFGLENPLSTRFWSAVKTGTSKDMKDNWCVGYSARYTVGVWVGNFSGEPMWNVSGTSGAAPVWLEVMNILHANEPSLPKQAPQNVINKEIQVVDTGVRRNEVFIKGTAPESVALQEHKAAIKITYPPRDSIIAIDPDIPPEEQKIFFENSAKDDHLEWVLNGEKLGSAKNLAWTPAKGSYRLALVDRNTNIVDETTFSVR